MYVEQVTVNSVFEIGRVECPMPGRTPPAPISAVAVDLDYRQIHALANGGTLTLRNAPAPSRPLPDRLAWDRKVSDVDPVVKGTWITAHHIISMIVDGIMWADILRSHPELTLDDIMAAVLYECGRTG